MNYNKEVEICRPIREELIKRKRDTRTTETQEDKYFECEFQGLTIKCILR